MNRSTRPDFGVFGLAFVFFLVGMQGLQWLRTAPPDASSTRYWLVILQLILGFGVGIWMASLTLVRYLRR